MLLPRLHTHELPWPHYWNLISLPCLLLHPKNTDYLTPSMHWTKIFVECYSLFSGFCKNMTALMISFLKIPLIFENTSIASNIRKHIFKCKSRLHFVLSILLHVNGQFFFFFILLLRLNNFNCSVSTLACFFLHLHTSVVEPSTSYCSSR